MKKMILLLVTLFITIVPASADNLRLEDLTRGAYSARGISGVRPLNDGERYSQIVDGKIVARSFRTGEQTDVLFDPATARGDVRLNGFSGYIMSPDEQTILIETERRGIYRHSYTAVYYIYNVRNRTLVPLSDGGPQ